MLEIKPFNLRVIPLRLIVEGQQFRNVDQGRVDELKASIIEHGLLQPIGLKKTRENQYRIVFGHHRYVACKELGWKSIPSHIMDLEELDASFTQIAENLNRNEKVNYVLLGEWFNQLISSGWTCEAIGKRVSKSSQYVSECCAIHSKLIPEVQSMIGDRFGRAIAVEITTLPKEKQKLLAQRIEVENLSGLSISASVEALSETGTNDKEDISPSFFSQADGFSQSLHTSHLDVAGLRLIDVTPLLHAIGQFVEIADGIKLTELKACMDGRDFVQMRGNILKALGIVEQWVNESIAKSSN